MAEKTAGAAATSTGAETKTPAAAGAETKVEEKVPATTETKVETKVEEKPVEKPAEGKAGEKAPEGKKAEETKVESKAPEKYELKTPDGAADYVTPDVTKRIEALARANDLDNDAAQGLLQEHVALMQAQTSAFLAETKADKTYGGDNLAATQSLARAAIDKLRPEGHPRRESFLRFLNAAGVGNQIDVVAFLADIGKSMAEDSPAAARGTGNETGSQADKLYDNPASKALHAQS